MDVVGLLSVSNSTIVAMVIEYSACRGPSAKLNFTNNKLVFTKTYGIQIRIHCQPVQILVKDSLLETMLQYISMLWLITHFSWTTAPSLGPAYPSSPTHTPTTTKTVTAARHYLLNSQELLHFNLCFILTWDMLKTALFFSTFSSNSPLLFYGTTNNTNVELSGQNLTVFDKLSFTNVAFACVNCTFERKDSGLSYSAIQASNSKVIFEGDITFRNHSAFVGAGVQLLHSSHLLLQPHTSVLFENSHADYVGGAIYTDSNGPHQCFYYTTSLTTVEVTFVWFFSVWTWPLLLRFLV